MSSQDTVTTGSGIVINLDRSRSCSSPVAAAAEHHAGSTMSAAAAAAASYSDSRVDTGMSFGRSLGGQAAGRAASESIFGTAGSLPGSSNSSWQLAAGGDAKAAVGAAAATCKDTTLLLPELQQLLTHQLGAAAAQQLLPQQHTIQANYAMQDPATAYVLERAPMPATSNFEHVREPVAPAATTARQLQDLLPSVGAGQAAVTAGAAAAKDIEQGSSGFSSNERVATGRGGRLGRPLLLLRQLKAAGRRLRGKQGAAANAGSVPSEHLLGFTGGQLPE
jgi:hypothetical protein